MKKLVCVMFGLLLGFNSLNADGCKETLDEAVGTARDREIFVIVDQTTPFPKDIRQKAIINIFDLINGRTALNLFTFSEFTKDKKISYIDHYYFHENLSKEQRYDMGKNSISEFEQCYQAEQNGLRKKLAQDIYSNFKEENQESKNSEILYSFKKIAKGAIKVSPTKQKMVFILSDMLENSHYTSFYGKELKHLNIKKEISLIREKGLIADFGGADIIVLGAGIVDNETYRDGEDFDKLEEFWTEYFKMSNANLKVFYSVDIKYPIINFYR